MMKSEPSILIEGLGKLYSLGSAPASSLREAFHKIIHRRPVLRHKATSEVNGSGQDSIWALKDISLSVQKGEAIGIIGRNGAGKSTLLKILSRITEPTRGRVELFGRVGALLEVGTGFHSELTGRENIYLNGTILGMKRKEVKAKFDEIVDFSGVEKFIETPIKHYSSGMKVRLAFSVAAHLNPEILLIDEVLAVGDLDFQKKCIGKMESVVNEGRTILFVSHNMSSITKFCRQSILIDNGRIINRGATQDVISSYLNSSERHGDVRKNETGSTVISNCYIGSKGNLLAWVHGKFSLFIEVKSSIARKVAIGISIEDNFGKRLIGALSSNQNKLFELSEGDNTISYNVESLPLNEGTYYLTLAIHDYPSNIVIDRVDGFRTFDVINNLNSDELLLSPSDGPVVVKSDWKLQ